jgi:hypothetical protein
MAATVATPTFSSKVPWSSNQKSWGSFSITGLRDILGFEHSTGPTTPMIPEDRCAMLLPIPSVA